MSAANVSSIRERLGNVLSEMREQSHLANHFGGASLSFDEVDKSVSTLKTPGSTELPSSA